MKDVLVLKVKVTLFSYLFLANMFIAVVFLKEKLRADDIFGTDLYFYGFSINFTIVSACDHFLRFTLFFVLNFIC